MRAEFNPLTKLYRFPESECFQRCSEALRKCCVAEVIYNRSVEVAVAMGSMTAMSRAESPEYVDADRSISMDFESDMER